MKNYQFPWWHEMISLRESSYYNEVWKYGVKVKPKKQKRCRTGKDLKKGHSVVKDAEGEQ